MEKSAPTRQQLLKLRARHDVIRKGLDLLKSRREALMKEFFNVVGESMDMREGLTKALGRAQRRLALASALDSEALDSFANAAKRYVSLEIKMMNIWGVNVPEIKEKPLIRSMRARDISPAGERAEVFDVARDFEAAADLIVKLSSKEAVLGRVGEAIRADTRKINAIQEVILPSIKGRIRDIKRVLEERERDDLFRLKRFKSKGRNALI